MICDLHVHTKYSFDSNALMEDYCIKALQNNVQCICFTDHIDHNPKDPSYGYYRIQGFFNEFSDIKNRYGHKVNLLCGIEFSEPHIYKSEFERYQKLPYDYIIGSIHFWKDDLFPSEMIKHNTPIEVCYAAYWDEVLKAVSCGGFDCLGHIDFPRRYYKKLLFDQSQLSDIFSAMLKNNIILEINTSSLRQGLNESLPDNALLKLYRSVGGQYVSIGSDAHRPEDLSADNHYAKKLIKDLSLKEVFFRQHNAVIINE